MAANPTLLAGFQDRGDITLGPAVFNTYDANGVAWVVTDLDGWWELPPVTLPDDPRPYELDGSYVTPGRYNSRIITLTGSLVPPSGLPTFAKGRGQLSTEFSAYAREVLSQVADLVRNTTLLKVYEHIPKQAEVQITGSPSFKNTKRNGVIDFQLSLRAADPRKYSQALFQLGSLSSASTAVSATASVTTLQSMATPVTAAFNQGSYTTGAVIVIPGPATNPVIKNEDTGQTITIVDTIPAGHFYFVDLMNRYLLYDGVDSRRSKLAIGSRWFLLHGGLNHISFNGSPITASSTDVSMWFRSAWIY